jgi:hypothetical protein
MLLEAKGSGRLPVSAHAWSVSVITFAPLLIVSLAFLLYFWFSGGFRCTPRHYWMAPHACVGQVLHGDLYADDGHTLLSSQHQLISLSV